MDVRRLLYVFIFFCGIYAKYNGQGNNHLEIRRYGIGTPKIYQVYIGERLVYKLRGDWFYKRGNIILLQDSIVLLDNGTETTLKDLKKIRLSKHHHLLQTLQGVFTGFGFGFFPLNTVNQLITGNEPVISEIAALVSVSSLGVACVLREMNFKRVKINKRTSLRIAGPVF